MPKKTNYARRSSARPSSRKTVPIKETFNGSELVEFTRMNVFKTFTFTWQQGLLFKWGVFAIGIAVGAYWSEFFRPVYFPTHNFFSSEFDLSDLRMVEANVNNQKKLRRGIA